MLVFGDYQWSISILSNHSYIKWTIWVLFECLSGVNLSSLVISSLRGWHIHAYNANKNNFQAYLVKNVPENYLKTTNQLIHNWTTECYSICIPSVSLFVALATYYTCQPPAHPPSNKKMKYFSCKCGCALHVVKYLKRRQGFSCREGVSGWNSMQSILSWVWQLVMHISYMSAMKSLQKWILYDCLICLHTQGTAICTCHLWL